MEYLGELWVLIADSVEKGGVRYDFLSPQGKVKPNLYVDLMAEFFKQRQAYYLPLRVEKDDE